MWNTSYTSTPLWVERAINFALFFRCYYKWVSHVTGWFLMEFKWYMSNPICKCQCIVKQSSGDLHPSSPTEIKHAIWIQFTKIAIDNINNMLSLTCLVCFLVFTLSSNPLNWQNTYHLRSYSSLLLTLFQYNSLETNKWDF